MKTDTSTFSLNMPILDRESLEVMGHFGRIGRYAGQFVWLHNVAVDSKGNIYTTEVHTGKRIQKFNCVLSNGKLENLKNKNGS